MMRYTFKYIVPAALCMFATGAHADCFVAYKAKNVDDGLRLHYGVMQLGTSNECANPKPTIASRLTAHGWSILMVSGQLSDADLPKAKVDAGDYFLKY